MLVFLFLKSINSDLTTPDYFVTLVINYFAINIIVIFLRLVYLG